MSTSLPVAASALEIETRRIAREEAAAVLESDISPADWVDQIRSPLGKRAHLDAARRGDFPSRRVGKRVLVRRRDLDAFIERHPTAMRAPARPTANDGEDDLDREMAAAIARRPK